MAAPTQFSFTWAEIAELMVKKLDLHEGLWMPGIEYGLNVGVVGSSQEEAGPGLMAIATKLQLTKVEAGIGGPEHMVVDAAKINPSSK